MSEEKKISWRRWKLGVVIAAATGFFTGLLALGVGTPWKGALLLLGASIGKDFVLWIQNYPVQSIDFNNGDTTTITASTRGPDEPGGAPKEIKP